jgi:hypothetical protein
MTQSYNFALMVSAALSVIAALLHVGCIIGGPSWYRFFGAGERMAKAAERGSMYPTLVTSGIIAVLLVWAAYALSAAGVLPSLPLLKAGIIVITAVYLIRGLVMVPVLVMAPGKATPFVIWSSLICLGYGTVHLVGVVQIWSRL